MMTCVGILESVAAGGIPALIRYFGILALTVMTLYPLFRIGTLGGGDVKLYGVCCGFFPKDKILTFLFFSLLFAAIFSLIRFIRKADLADRLAYFFSYVKEVANSGEWKLYWSDVREKRNASVCLAGPILISILLWLGGIY